VSFFFLLRLGFFFFGFLPFFAGKGTGKDDLAARNFDVCFCRLQQFGLQLERESSAGKT